MVPYGENSKDYFEWLLLKVEEYIGHDIEDEAYIDLIFDNMLTALNIMKKKNFQCNNSHAVVALAVILNEIVTAYFDCNDFETFLSNVKYLSNICDSGEIGDNYSSCNDFFNESYIYVIKLKLEFKKKFSVINDDIKSICNINYSNKIRAIKSLQLAIQLIEQSDLPDKIIAYAIKEINSIIEQLNREKTNWAIVSTKTIGSIALFTTLATLTSGVDAMLNIKNHLIASQDIITSTATNPRLVQSVPFQLGKIACHTPMLSSGSGKASLPMK